jgi:hypothetical protein
MAKLFECDLTTVDVNERVVALQNLQAGHSVIYHRGLLANDKERANDKEDNRTLLLVAEAAWQGYCAGRLALVQRPVKRLVEEASENGVKHLVEKLEHEYIAVGRAKPHVQVRFIGSYAEQSRKAPMRKPTAEAAE